MRVIPPTASMVALSRLIKPLAALLISVVGSLLPKTWIVFTFHPILMSTSPLFLCLKSPLGPQKV